METGDRGGESRRTMLAGAALIAASSLGGAAWGQDAPVAKTTAGSVRGYNDQGIKAFRGVRYGADTAPRRFMPPLAPTPWSGVIDATAYGPASPQGGIAEKTSEDCLFLNVYTPGLRDGKKRPVMFYIHGGAYASGSGSSPLYDGVKLCRRSDVVVVTVNHRLNLFGYFYGARLAGPAFADSGNAGMLDLIFALQWVRDNIAEFGGDPGRVMLFGQSGGGAKIATLMAMPAAKGLFHRAATMSGQQVTASGPLNATKRAETFLKALSLTPARIDELRALPFQKLVEARATDPVIGSGGVYFGPVLDERTLTRHPFYPDAPAISANIPMIIGNTHDETRSLIGGVDPSAFTLKWDDLPAKLGPALRVDITPETVIAEYRRLYPAYSPSDVFFAATTAGRSWRGAIIEAEARAAQTPAFAYQLDWASPQDGGKWGAPHTLDIPLVFGTLDAPGSITGISPEAKAASDRISDAFAALARTGDPSTKAIGTWAAYTLPRRQTMIFGNTAHMADDPRGAERRLFAKVPFLQQGT